MGKHFTLTSSDSFKLGAYRADPAGAKKGGIVVIQEIFGVNHHIRAVCDRLAGEGYAALAPAVFDRQQPNFECGYTPDEIANARKFVANPDWGAMLRDVQASIDELKKEGPVAIMGFCMGGTISFLAACKLNGLSAAVCYYGGQIAKNRRREAEGAVPDALRREGRLDPDDRRRDDQAEARRGLRNLRLSRRAARLPLRRARQLPGRRRQARLAALDGVPHEEREEINLQRPSPLTPTLSPPGRGCSRRRRRSVRHLDAVGAHVLLKRHNEFGCVAARSCGTLSPRGRGWG